MINDVGGGGLKIKGIRLFAKGSKDLLGIKKVWDMNYYKVKTR